MKVSKSATADFAWAAHSFEGRARARPPQDDGIWIDMTGTRSSSANARRLDIARSPARRRGERRKAPDFFEFPVEFPVLRHLLEEDNVVISND